jgi:hypothetical protein
MAPKRNPRRQQQPQQPRRQQQARRQDGDASSTRRLPRNDANRAGNKDRDRDRDRGGYNKGYIDKDIDKLSDNVAKYNAAYGCAVWYQMFLNAIDWPQIKLLHEYVHKLHLPAEIERILRDVHGSQDRLTRYALAAQEDVVAYGKMMIRTELGYFTDRDNVLVQVGDVAATTQLFLHGNLMFGPIDLKARLAQATNRKQLFAAAAAMLERILQAEPSRPKVELSAVMTRIDYDQMTSTFYAHYSARGGRPDDYMITVQFRVDSGGGLALGRILEYQAFVSDGHGKVLVETDYATMAALLKVSFRPSAVAAAAAGAGMG